MRAFFSSVTLPPDPPPASPSKRWRNRPGAPRLRVLAPTRYPWRFNGPRHSRHEIRNRSFLPLNFISPKIEGLTMLNPLPPARFDLVHGFNRIPVGTTPFVIGFESHLPRAFGLEDTAYVRALSRLLASSRCRGIVAISDHAADVFARQHAGTATGDALLGKLSRRYPNIRMPAPTVKARSLDRSQPLRVAFVGNHFARKGGCVTVRVAEMAEAARLPVTFDIVSTLQVGGSIWSDPADPAVFAPYLRGLSRPNIRWRQSLAGADVEALLGAADLCLLPTLGDTFGYSAVEAMANGTPLIATRQGALPEFIRHEENGFLLPLETSAMREWVHLGAPDRRSSRFARIFIDEVERMAAEIFPLVDALVHQPERLARLQKMARLDAQQLFDSTEASRFWDDYYVEAVADVA